MTGTGPEHLDVYTAFLAWALIVAAVLALAAAHEVLSDRRMRAQAAGDQQPPAFVCPECGAQSWHPDDGRFGYCGRCRDFTGRPAGLDIPSEQRTA